MPMVSPFKGANVDAARFSSDSKKLAVNLWKGRCYEMWDVLSQTLDIIISKPAQVKAGRPAPGTPLTCTSILDKQKYNHIGRILLLRV